MRLSKIDLNLFVTFEAIYNKRSLTRAAEELCVTQPAVSNALARMRKSFSDLLFVSTPSGMVPTPVAENMIARVREALHLLNTSSQEGDAFVPAMSQRVLRLSMTDLTEAILLPALGEVLQQHAPAMRVESYFTPRSEVATALASGAVDVAIDVPLINDPQLRHMPLMQDRYACLLRRDHPFTGDKLTLEDYLGLGHIQVSSRRQGSGHVEVELNKLGKRRVIQMRVQHYMVAPLIAMRTDLALTGPLRLLHRTQGRIIGLPFEVPPLEWHCYWHRSAEQDQANRWLRQELVRLVEDVVT